MIAAFGPCLGAPMLKSLPRPQVPFFFFSSTFYEHTAFSLIKPIRPGSNNLAPNLNLSCKSRGTESHFKHSRSLIYTVHCTTWILFFTLHRDRPATSLHMLLLCGFTFCIKNLTSYRIQGRQWRGVFLNMGLWGISGFGHTLAVTVIVLNTSEGCQPYKSTVILSLHRSSSLK